MKEQLEKSLKRYLKNKITITSGIIVAFLITGNISYSTPLSFAKNPIKTETVISDDIEITAGNDTQAVYGVYDTSNGSSHGNLKLTGKNITIKHSLFNNNQGGSAGVAGILAMRGGEVNLGSEENASNILIESKTDSEIAIGLWAYTESGKGGKYNVNGNSLTINVESEETSAYGIYLGNNEFENSDIVINTDNTNITAVGKSGHGMKINSGAKVKINSKNTTIKGANVIYAEKGSLVEINKSGDKNNTVKLDGNIIGWQESENTLENSGIYVNLSNKDSYLTGNISTPDNVELGITNGANWNMTGGSSLSGTVTLQGGTINLGEKDGLSITGNGLVMNGTGEGYNSTITGTGNINSNVAISNTGNIFNLGEGSTLTGKVTLADKANAQNQGYLALGKDSNISVGQGATFTNEEGATIKGTTNNQKVIEVNGGTAINNGTIDLTGTTGSYAMYATNNDSTLKNIGFIKVDYKGENSSKAFGADKDITAEATNTGKVQIYGYDGETGISDKKALEKLMLNLGVNVNEGMIVAYGEDGHEITFSNNDIVGDNLTITQALDKIPEGSNKLDIGGKEETTTLTLDGKNLESKDLASLNLYGKVELVAGEKNNEILFDGVNTNMSDDGVLVVGENNYQDRVNLTIKDANVIKDKDKMAIELGTYSTLNLNSANIIGGIKGSSFDGAETLNTFGNTSITGEVNVGNVNVKDGTTKFDGKISSSNLIVDGKGTEAYFTSNSVIVGQINNENEGVSIFEVDNDGNNALVNSSQVDLNGDFKITTSGLTKDTTILLGESNNLEDANFISDSNKNNDIYITEFDEQTNTISAKYNKDLLSEYGDKLNNINNAFQVINDKISQDKLERADLANKVYAGTIYAETVRMAYDNNKLVENELLKINPEVATGEWAVNGKALYMKNEYTREGVIADYKSEKESTGLLASAEYGLNDTTNLGFAFAGINHSLDTDTGKADGDAFYLGAFAKKELGNYRLTAGLGYEFNRFDADENIFGGSEKYDANVYSAYVEGRYSKDLGDNLTFEPKLKLGYTYVDQDAIQDGTYKLDSQDVSIFDTEVGADFIKTVPLKDGRLDVVFGASYAMAFGDTDDEFEGRFIGTGGLSSTFNMVGANVAERNVNLGLGLGVTKASGLFYNGGVTFKAGSDNYRDYGITLGAGYKF